MLHLQYKKTSGVLQQRIASAAKRLLPLIQRLAQDVSIDAYAHPSPFISLPSDQRIIDDVSNCAMQFRNDPLKYVLIIGIGGSNLGTRAVYDAIFGYVDGVDPLRNPKALFLDTTDSPYAAHALRHLLHVVKRRNEILINVVSKSGRTMETMVNFRWVVQSLEKKIGVLADRIIVTTDFGSPLWTHAEKKKYHLLAIPKNVGGRFSVFSAVGLFPLMMLGVDIHALRKGAAEMQVKCLDRNLLHNPAILSASILFNQYQRGLHIHDTFLFSPALESLGKWYRQLLAESIGKKRSIGMTPTVSIGSTDLHSIAQLTFAGPRDKVTSMVTVKESVGKLNALSQTTNAIIEGVKRAYQGAHLPYVDIQLPDLSARSLGQFLQFKLMEVVYLGSLFGVNVYNQPQVELYKKEVQKALARKS